MLKKCLRKLRVLLIYIIHDTLVGDNKMKFLGNKISPDVDELIAVIKREKIPKRVHFIELFIDQVIKDLICKRFELDKDINRDEPFANLKREIKIHTFLGYDAFRVKLTENIFPRQNLITPDTTTITGQDKGNRSWTDEHTGPVQSWKDFDSYPWPKVSDIDFSAFEWLEENLPENMGCYDLTAHILEQVTWLIGYESLSYKLYDEPELVNSVFEKVGQFYIDYTKTLCDFSCIKLIWGADDMGFRTSTLFSPDLLREKVLPWHKRCAQISHENNKPYLLHACGNLEKIMNDLIDEVNIDAKHSYEDVILPVTEVKRRYGNRMAILGGIDVDFLCRADEKAIRKRVRETLDICMQGGGYCLGTGNSVANYIPVDNYLIMLDEGRRFIL